MTRVINNWVYDTDKAEVIYEESSCLNIFTLYKTKNGHYFFQNGTRTIKPITEQEARNWVGANLEADRYKELFPDQILHEA